MTYVLIAALLLGTLAVLFGVGLAFASRVFRLEQDPRIEKIEETLPGANCGACGFGGCSAYAQAVVAGKVGPSECIPGGMDVARVVADIMGLTAEAKEKRVAVILCNGGNKVAARNDYHGVPDCRAAVMMQDGPKGCHWGCLGLGTCVRSCPFDAMVLGEDGLPHVIEERCTACGTCAEVCPKYIIKILPSKNMVHALCRSHDKGGEVKKLCSVGCIGCKKCEQVCPVEGKAIHVHEFLAEVDVDKCISCGKCVAACPMGTIGNFRLSRRGRVDKLKGQGSA